jgi:signal transduction histidine kinase
MTTPQSTPGSFLAGGGEMGARMRAFDWAQTPLGPPQGWPQSLKTIVRVLLDSRYAMWMLWGPELTFFCNDAYLPTVGLKRDWVLGARSDRVWEEIWPDIGPRIGHVLDSGEATWDEALLLFLERSGFAEETYHTFSYSPVYDDDGRRAGMLCVVTEVTDRVIGERRLKVLRDLAACAIGAQTVPVACERLCSVLESYPLDVPFAALYLRLPDGSGARRAATTRCLPESLAPETWRTDDPGDVPVGTVLATGRAQVLDALTSRGIVVPAGRWRDPVERVLALPLGAGAQDHPAGVLLVGVSPRRPFDDDYRTFLGLVAGLVASAIGDAETFEAEKRRAQALAELDRAKTAFFSNVSHEFRTPLTLLLGPVENAAKRPDGAVTGADLAMVHRNAQRLLKLVNTLLDFSRIEAGRVEATYVATDVAALTRDVASTFRSAIERAGLEFIVEARQEEGSLPEVYVDRGMWEKIVLNLLSNAFKFTFEGRIRVRVADEPAGLVLEVEDTGVGVPEAELPRLFERFHRVEGTRGRAHEGSGIGLALVQELVRLHGGRIEVASTLGRGTVFTVRLPRGRDHLPADRVRTEAPPPVLAGADAYVEEALRWLPDGAAEPGHAGVALPAAGPGAASRPRVVLADDNADMRSYVAGLLAPRYAVEAVADGEAALAAVRRAPPAAVVSDVMMPGMDGFALLAAIRTDPELAATPVILVSARAGEEARIEGLDAGADEYLVKPFSARELLASVGNVLKLAAQRREALAEIEASERRFRALASATSDVVYRMSADWRELRHLVGRDFVADSLSPTTDWLDIYLDPADRPAVLAAIDAAVRERRMFELEHRVRRVDGTFGWALSRAVPLVDDAGQVLEWFGTATDITERRRVEEELRRTSRQKDEFLATLAHELRNPLAPVRNATRLLAAADVEPARRAWAAAVIDRQVHTMALLLDDLLDVSRITRGKLPLQRRPIPIAQVIDAALEVSRPVIEGRRHVLSVSLPDPSVDLEGDPLRLSQLLSNLLTNAAKYTDPGGRIEVSVASDPPFATIAVTDTGIGLDPEVIPRLFEMFSQVKSALDRSEGGLGIGLALVKGLVEMHGGSIEATSPGPGRGSTFRVRLPLAARAAVAAPRTVTRSAPHPQRRHRVLVADDNRDAADSLAAILRLDGHDVYLAYDGREALAAVDRLRPSLAVLDIGMPTLNGYDVAREIRRHAWGEHVTLIALTGWGQDDDRRRAVGAGFDLHLTKPVDPDELAALVAERGLRESRQA